MDALREIAPELGALLVGVPLFVRALRVAPLGMLAATALMGVLVNGGAVGIPETPLSARIDAAQASIREWQSEQSTRISCGMRVKRALYSEDQAALDAAAPCWR